MDIAGLHSSIHKKAVVSYSRSGGPGGQNVNKLNTKVTLRVRLADLEGLSGEELDRLREKLASRISGEGELVIAAEEERSQRINRERAFFRTEALIVSAARLPKRRRAVKPSRAAREQRLQTKRILGIKKKERRFTPEE
ncbi:MAG: aminoacyl-tRNA hydrolase [Treponema sp.]|jgi:ribosome-associated protein|nr:aminoacyl-tRNA hydrolase [Treponema sp.]